MILPGCAAGRSGAHYTAPSACANKEILGVFRAGEDPSRGAVGRSRPMPGVRRRFRGDRGPTGVDRTSCLSSGKSGLRALLTDGGNPFGTNGTKTPAGPEPVGEPGIQAGPAVGTAGCGRKAKGPRIAEGLPYKAAFTYFPALAVSSAAASSLLCSGWKGTRERRIARGNPNRCFPQRIDTANGRQAAVAAGAAGEPTELSPRPACKTVSQGQRSERSTAPRAARALDP